MELSKHKQIIAEDGFTVIDGIYSNAEVDTILKVIEAIDTSGATFP